jgi:hypothetical protein
MTERLDRNGDVIQDSLFIDYPMKADGSVGPNIPQLRAHTVSDMVTELLYGGAAGGGKTQFLIAEALHVAFKFPGSNSVLIRKNWDALVELGGIQQQLLNQIPPSIGKYNGAPAHGSSRMVLVSD